MYTGHVHIHIHIKINYINNNIMNICHDIEGVMFCKNKKYL